MGLSLYQITVPTFIHHFNSLSAILKKGQEHAAPNEAALIESRLIPDMANLAFQVQTMSDSAKFVGVRIGHAENVAMADTEKTFPELQERIRKTVEFLEKLDPKCMDGMEETEVVFKTGPTERRMLGTSYVQDFAVPNFYFHFCMAYAILRKEGVPVGKRDFLALRS